MNLSELKVKLEIKADTVISIATLVHHAITNGHAPEGMSREVEDDLIKSTNLMMEVVNESVLTVPETQMQMIELLSKISPDFIQASTEERSYLDLSGERFEVFKRKYLNAEAKNNIIFEYEGNEVLTSYAKYVIEYVNSMKDKS